MYKVIDNSILHQLSTQRHGNFSVIMLCGQTGCFGNASFYSTVLTVYLPRKYWLI